jgi:hypothetical protein
MNFWKFGKWARAFGRMGVQHPHFLKLAPTLGSANSSKIHGKWKFHFFPKKKSPKSSVMEMFCTPLQCKVDLSMFHSSSTSKIWHTST